MKPLHHLAGRDIDRSRQHSKERTARKATLARLEQRLAGLKGGHRAPEQEGNTRIHAPGLGAIDACFNAGGLPMAAVHEIWTDGMLERTSAAGFAIALGCHLARAQQGAHMNGARAGGDLVWIYPRRGAQEWGLPYGPGLMAFGHDPARLILVETRNAIEALWAGEEALRAASPSSVVVALDGTYGAHAFIASRRLELAARAGTASAFLLCPGAHASASAASLRWRIAPVPGRAHAMAVQADSVPMPARGHAFPANLRWRVTLERNRQGHGGTWIVEWNHERATLAAIDAAKGSDVGAVAGALAGRTGTSGEERALRGSRPERLSA